MSRSLRIAWVGLAGGALLCAGCARGVPSYQSLHVVDGEVVHSRPIASAAYEAYLRARLAMESEPRQLDVARENIDRALRFDARDPQLWTTRSEIAALAGADQDAVAAARHALELSPGYPPAQRLIAKLKGEPGSAVASTPLEHRP